MPRFMLLPVFADIFSACRAPHITILPILKPCCAPMVVDWRNC